jgi:WD40 repeat protein
MIKSVSVFGDRGLIAVSRSSVHLLAVDASSKSLELTRKLEVSPTPPAPILSCPIVDAVECSGGFIVATRDEATLHDVRLPGSSAARVVFASAEKHLTSPLGALRRLRVSALSCCGPSANTVALGDEDGEVHVFDLRQRGGQGVWGGGDGGMVTRVAADSRGAVVSGGADGVVRVWSGGGEVVGTYPIHSDAVTGACWLGDSGFASLCAAGRLSVNQTPVGVAGG